MRPSFPGMTVLAVVVALSTTATAHHSSGLYFDSTKTITLEGEILRVEWINPHILLFIQSKSDKGEPETWVLQGMALNNAVRRVGLKERLQPGISISARAHPPRNSVFLNDALTVLLTRSDDPRTSSRIVEAGQIRFPDGEVQAFGGGPAF